MDTIDTYFHIFVLGPKEKETSSAIQKKFTVFINYKQW